MRVSWLLYKIHTVHSVSTLGTLQMSVVEQKLRYLLTSYNHETRVLYSLIISVSI